MIFGDTIRPLPLMLGAVAIGNHGDVFSISVDENEVCHDIRSEQTIEPRIDTGLLVDDIIEIRPSTSNEKKDCDEHETMSKNVHDRPLLGDCTLNESNLQSFRVGAYCRLVLVTPVNWLPLRQQMTGFEPATPRITYRPVAFGVAI